MTATHMKQVTQNAIIDREMKEFEELEKSIPEDVRIGILKKIEEWASKRCFSVSFEEERQIGKNIAKWLYELGYIVHEHKAPDGRYAAVIKWNMPFYDRESKNEDDYGNR